MKIRVFIKKIFIFTLFFVLIILFFKGCKLPTGIEEGFSPTTPTPISPVDGSNVQTQTPTLTVHNSKEYSGSQIVYNFEVFSDSGMNNLVAAGNNIPAGSINTSWQITQNLQPNVEYFWRARGFNGTVYSPYTSTWSFIVLMPCRSRGRGVGPWGKAIVAAQIGCLEHDNLFTNPTEALGPSDAWRIGTSTFRIGGVVSLGLKGYIVVDMGVCIVNNEGNDLRVYQYIAHEPIKVLVSPMPDGPWADLGVQSCHHPFCEFDLEGCIYDEIRYVKIIDQDPTGECVGPSRYTPGADIDAVMALHYR